ncbi:NAD(P)/FAD-dependent oxidoreductase [Brachybacterium sp. DNPG3]
MTSTSPTETITAPTADPTGTADDAVRDEIPGDVVDVAVLGGGAAGLNGALMLARSRRSVVVIDAGDPRNAPADGVHGLLGNEGTPPSELLARGRREVREYGGLIVTGRVASAAASPSPDGDLGFEIVLADGRVLRARRILVATGTRDRLPEIEGLARHWGRGLVHCPYCHGWEVRDEPIGILATGAMAVHQALLFRQLSDDVVMLAGEAGEAGLDPADRERLRARGIRIIEGAVAEVLADETAATGLAGVKLADGTVVPRSVLAVSTVLEPRLDGLEGLGLPVEDLPAGMGRRVVAGQGGATAVPGVWAAGNVADPSAQVGPSAAGGALAGAHINAMLAMAEADAAVAALAPAASI